MTTDEQRRLAQAILDNVDWDEDAGDGWCRYCQNWYAREGHAYDCVAVIARDFLTANHRGKVSDTKEGP